jgi:hypothetical protein
MRVLGKHQRRHSHEGLSGPMALPPATDIAEPGVWHECCCSLDEPLRFAHREAAMDEVIDCTPTANSPEELAIRFLLRHAECRMALTGQAAPAGPQDARAVRPALGASHLSVPALRRAAAPVAEVTKDDSCAARYSRAYAAARHRPASAGSSRAARTAA